MTRRGSRKVSERRSGTGEDERQSVMARLDARWRRSNWVTSVTLRKGNHPGEVYVKSPQRKALYRTERYSHDEAKIQRKALR